MNNQKNPSQTPSSAAQDHDSKAKQQQQQQDGGSPKKNQGEVREEGKNPRIQPDNKPAPQQQQAGSDADAAAQSDKPQQGN
jgi:hypothetical protein